MIFNDNGTFGRPDIAEPLWLCLADGTLRFGDNNLTRDDGEGRTGGPPVG